MLPELTSLSFLTLLQATEPVADEAGPSPAPAPLLAIDELIAALAVVIIGAVGIRWLAVSRKDPLRLAPPRPNRLREDVLALTILIYLLAVLFFSGLAKLVTGETEGVLASLMIGSGAQLAAGVACLVVAAKYFDGGLDRFWIGPGLARQRAGILVLVLIVLAIGLCPLALNVTIHVVLYFAPEHVFEAHPTIEALRDEAQPWGIVVALWIGAAVVAPVAEELFFRGLVQTFLVNVARRRWLAIIAASVAFGVMHWGYPHHVPALILLAVLMGYAYERTGSLLPPVIIHAAFNLKTLIWSALDGFSA
jgi:membrane protease YdiL (CAAX protease family)